MPKINVIKYDVEIDSKRHPKLVPEERYRYQCEEWMFNADSIAHMMREYFRLDYKAEEYAYALAFSACGELLGVFELAHGHIGGTEINVRNLMIRMLLSGAHGFVVVHNHPSGKVTPSTDDLRTCKIIRAIGDMMEIPCLDFLIVGRSAGREVRCFSFRVEGRMNDAIVIDIKTQENDLMENGLGI